MIHSLHDSGGMLGLMWQDSFNHLFRLWFGPAEGSETKAHNMFDLKNASSGAIPLTQYIELGMAFLG